MIKEYKSLTDVAGPIIIIEGVEECSFGELVEVYLPDGTIRKGEVLEAHQNHALVQMFEGTSDLNIASTRIRFKGRPIEINLSPDIIGRIFNGFGKPIDQGGSIISEKSVSIIGNPINPYSRDYPSEFIQTGISSIDGLSL